MTLRDSLTLELTAWGTARASLAEAAAMRKRLPQWVPADTPGHFLKHADEQTIVAVAAVDQAIGRGQLELSDLRQRLVISAPRYMGRIAGAASLQRYSRGGGPALSPHLIPQHSLHSVSGALSILLASRQPNLGVGGVDDSLVEGLLLALSLPRSGQSSGVLLVATAWTPEPVLDTEANCVNEPVCHALALDMQPAAGCLARGTLELKRGASAPRGFGSERESHRVTVPQLCDGLESLASGSGRGLFCWTACGGARLVLQVDAAANRLAA